MYRNMRIVLGVGIVIAVLMCLFPPWAWEVQPQKRYLIGHIVSCILTHPDGAAIHKTAHSFILHSPHKTASIDTGMLFNQFWLLALVEYATLAMTWSHREIAQQKESNRYWRQKWQYSSATNDMLLRASSATTVPSDVLVRSSQAMLEAQPEQLLRSSDPEKRG